MSRERNKCFVFVFCFIGSLLGIVKKKNRFGVLQNVLKYHHLFDESFVFTPLNLGSISVSQTYLI